MEIPNGAGYQPPQGLGEIIVRALKVAVFVLALTAATGGRSQTADPMQMEFEREIARWKVQQTAGERDVKLVGQVKSAFYTAAKLSGPVPQIADVNAALAPLKSRYPDYRLNYRAVGDYCRVSRAITDARLAAYNRISRSLTQQRKILALSTSYNLIIMKTTTGELLGQPFQKSDVVQAFREVMAEGRVDEIETDWGVMDSMTEPLFADEDEDCS